MSEFVKVKTKELDNDALDWVLAKLNGIPLRDPIYASNEDVENLQVPFVLYDVISVSSDEDDSVCLSSKVDEIVVTRYGIDTTIGASSPSIDFSRKSQTEDEKKKGPRSYARGSVDLFFLKKEEAELETQVALKGFLEDYSPSSNKKLAFDLIEKEFISITIGEYDTVDDKVVVKSWAARSLNDEINDNFGNLYGPTMAIAGLRCLVNSKCGPEVEVPAHLVNNSLNNTCTGCEIDLSKDVEGAKNVLKLGKQNRP